MIIKRDTSRVAGFGDFMSVPEWQTSEPIPESHAIAGSAGNPTEAPPGTPNLLCIGEPGGVLHNPFKDRKFGPGRRPFEGECPDRRRPMRQPRPGAKLLRVRKQNGPPAQGPTACPAARYEKESRE